MTDFTTRLNEMLSQPVLPWTILGVVVVGVLLGQVQKHVPDDPIERKKRLFGVPNIPHGLALLIAVLWGALLLVLFVGLVTLLYEIVWGMTAPVSRDDEGDFRFLLAKITALTAVLGALVALPFTALRLKLTTEQNRHNQDVLYNENLHNAITDLHARYQRTNGESNGRHDVWEDDIIRRVGAIDRLEALVVERNEMAPRIARTLCVYLKEMTREHPADSYDHSYYRSQWLLWHLRHKRADMEAAAQVLGRLPILLGLDSEKDEKAYLKLATDLSGVNLQGMDLLNLDFSHADLIAVALDCATVDFTKFNKAKLQGATFNCAILRGTSLNGARLYRAAMNEAQLYGTQFGLNADLRAVESKNSHSDLSISMSLSH